MIAVQPPAYFPDLAYMSLVVEADTFVLADTFSYERRTTQNRGRLRTPQGWQWIRVPLRGKQRGRPIDEVRIENRERWLVKHWRSFQYNYRSTPYFEFYEPELAPFFTQTWTHLGALTCASVELLCSLMQVPTRLVRASSLAERPASARAVRDAAGQEGTRLLALAGTRATSEAVLHADPPTYRQNFDGFEPGMSAADLLFNVGPEALSLIRASASVAPRLP